MKSCILSFVEAWRSVNLCNLFFRSPLSISLQTSASRSFNPFGFYPVNFRSNLFHFAARWVIRTKEFWITRRVVQLLFVNFPFSFISGEVYKFFGGVLKQLWSFFWKQESHRYYGKSKHYKLLQRLSTPTSFGNEKHHLWFVPKFLWLPHSYNHWYRTTSRFFSVRKKGSYADIFWYKNLFLIENIRFDSLWFRIFVDEQDSHVTVWRMWWKLLR